VRLSWPFGRRTPSDGPSSESDGGPAGDTADAPTADLRARASTRRRRVANHSAPVPIQIAISAKRATDTARVPEY